MRETWYKPHVEVAVPDLSVDELPDRGAKLVVRLGVIRRELPPAVRSVSLGVRRHCRCLLAGPGPLEHPNLEAGIPALLEHRGLET